MIQFEGVEREGHTFESSGQRRESVRWNSTSSPPHHPVREELAVNYLCANRVLHSAPARVHHASLHLTHVLIRAQSTTQSPLQVHVFFTQSFLYEILVAVISRNTSFHSDHNSEVTSLYSGSPH